MAWRSVVASAWQSASSKGSLARALGTSIKQASRSASMGQHAMQQQSSSLWGASLASTLSSSAMSGTGRSACAPALSLLASSMLSGRSNAGFKAMPAPPPPVAIPTRSIVSNSSIAEAGATQEIGEGEGDDDNNLGPRKPRKKLRHRTPGHDAAPVDVQHGGPVVSPDVACHRAPHSSLLASNAVAFRACASGAAGSASGGSAVSDPPGGAPPGGAAVTAAAAAADLTPQQGAAAAPTVPQPPAHPDAPPLSPHLYILSRSERRQQPLSRSDLAFLWRKAEEAARDDRLAYLRLGKAGPTPAWLAAVGDWLEAHELVRVAVPTSTGYEPEFISWLLQETQDCVLVRKKGHTVTLFRDASLPRAPASRNELQGVPAPVPSVPGADQQDHALDKQQSAPQGTGRPTAGADKQQSAPQGSGRPTAGADKQQSAPQGTGRPTAGADKQQSAPQGTGRPTAGADKGGEVEAEAQPQAAGGEAANQGGEPSTAAAVTRRRLLRLSMLQQHHLSRVRSPASRASFWAKLTQTRDEQL